MTQSTIPGVTAAVTDTVQTIQFNVTFNGLPAGLSVGNQSYLGWCPDFWGDFGRNTRSTPYTLYSSYDTARLPANAQNPNWAMVNWVLNNKPTGAQSTWVVQQVIWRLLANQYAPTSQGFPLPEPASDNLYNQAITQGAGFVPAVGQVVGILMYIDGIDPIPAQNGLPSNGQPNNFQEVLIEVPVGPGAIGDFVWQDTNQNGVQDAGEPGINGVTVSLCADSACSTVLATTTTTTFKGNDGYYQFSGLPLGTYWISINTSQPALTSLVATTTGAGNPATDSNVNPSVTTLTSSQPQDETIDFGFTSPGTSAIGDFVWQDNNANGLQDAGEPGISGLTVNLCADTGCGTILATTTTDQNGFYHFTGLFAGTYYVQVIPGAGFVPTQSQVGFPTNSDTDSGGPVAGVPNEVILPINTVDNSIDFGFIPPAQGSIGDFVWHDLNRNGIQDAGEPGINNVTVRLYNSSNALVATTTTITFNGQDGYYQFTGLATDSYTVVVDSTTLPPGYTATTSNAAGSTPATDSNGSPAAVALPTNISSDETIDFGYVSACAGVIGDFVWNDLNANGIQDAGEPGIPGVTVNLYDSNHVFLFSTTTDANGLYHFNGRCNGTYTVEVVPPVGFQPTISNAPGSTPDNDSNGSPATVTLGIDETNNTIDFGYYQTLTVTSGQCPSSASGEVGVAFNTPAISVTGGVPPLVFSVATGTLPAGLTLNPATGAITGTPSAPGSFTLQVTDATNASVAVGCPYTIVAGPSVTCSAVSSGEVGVSFNIPAITVTGGTAPFTFSVATGTLPAGLMLDASTGAITGTPSAPGTFTIQVTDANGVVATGTCPFTIVAAPTITCSATNSGEVGAAFNSPAMTVMGGTAPFTFSVATGTLPAGLTLNPSTGAITGTPSAPGTFTIQVTDANGVVATGTCPFTIVAAPTITCSATNSGEVGAPFNSAALTVTGGTAPFTFSVATGALPAGLTLNPSTGAITGTPSAPGTFTIQVTDANGVVAPGTCPFTIIAGPTLTCSAVNSGTAGMPFSSPAPTVVGGTAPYTFSIASGTLPAGLTLNADGSITGTPSAAGTFSIKVTDAKGVAATGTCPFTIAPKQIQPLTVSCPPDSTGQVGKPFTSNVPVTGGVAPYSYALQSGTLPPGLTLNPLTGEITGTPTSGGSFQFSVKVTDSAGTTAISACAQNCGNSTVIWDFSQQTGALGISQAYTVSGLTITAYGYTNPFNVPWSLFGHNDGPDKNGLGILLGGPNNEVNTLSYVQLDLGQVIAAGATNPMVTITSVQSGTTYAIYGSNSPGQLGTALLVNQTLDNTPFAIPGFPNYRYISVTATAGSVLVGSVSVSLGNCNITITAPVNLQCGSCIAKKDLVGVPYSNSLSVTGGTGPYKFAIISGSLPPGLTLNPDTGAVAGTPTTPGTYTFTTQVTDANGNTSQATCTIVIIGQPLNLSCGTCGSGKAYVGQPYSSSLAATGGVGPFTYSIISGALPPGLTLNPSTGAITGTPTTPGTYTFTSKVVDSQGNTDTATCTIVILPSPVTLNCGTCGASKAYVGTAYSASLSATGGTGPYTYSIISGSLPPGLTLNPSTGAITGRPTTPGTYTITSKVVDSKGNTDTAICTIVVTGTPIDLDCGTCGSGSSNGKVGSPYSAALAVTGGVGPFTYSIVSGSLPPGLTLNPSTGAITGTPTTPGTYTFTSKVVDSKGNSDTATCTIVVTGSPINLDCGSCGAGKATVGLAYSATFSVTGGIGPFTYSIASGSLPPGLTLSPSTGKITGTPTAPGNYTFTTKVVDSKGNTDTATCTIIVVGSPINLGCGTCGSSYTSVGASYSAKFSVSGGTSPYTYSIVSGSLPPGLSLNSSTGAITGSPTTAGTYTFTTKVVDSKGNSDTTICTITVQAPPVNLECGTCGASKASVGVSYSAKLAATGGSGKYTYSLASGSLPPGLTLNPSTGAITGTPTTAGTYTFTSKVVDSSGKSDTATCTIVVSAPIDLQCGTCGQSKVTAGTAYSVTLPVVGGTGPFTFSIASGSLPPGVTLNTSTGQISGTPTTAGTYTFTAKVVDSKGNTDTATCTLTVISPVNIECGTCGASNGSVGSPYSVVLPVTGGTGSYTFSIKSGSLPTGITLNTSTGKLSGTPSTAGSYTFTTKVVDSNGNADTTTCTITVSKW